MSTFEKDNQRERPSDPDLAKSPTIISHRPTSCPLQEFESISDRATIRLANFSSVESTSQLMFRAPKSVVVETEGLKNPGEILYLLSELSYFLIAVAQRSGRNAFRCIGRPQIRLAFLLVFCHGCKQHRVKALSPIRLWHRSPDCQVAVTPPDSVPDRAPQPLMRHQRPNRNMM